MKNAGLLVLSVVVASAASAQATPPSDYPSDATLVRGSDITTQLAGKVFSVKTATQGIWRLQFSDGGYLYLNTEGGYQDSGTWRVEGERWCANLRKTAEACSDLRVAGETYYYRRKSNGEVVSMKVR